MAANPSLVPVRPQLPSRRILKHLSMTVTQLVAAPLDNYGQPSAPPTPVTLPCRYTLQRKKVLDATGQEVVIEGYLFLAPTVLVAPRDKFLFGAPGSAARTYAVVSINLLYYRRRPSHLEVAIR